MSYHNTGRVPDLGALMRKTRRHQDRMTRARAGLGDDFFDMARKMASDDYQFAQVSQQCDPVAMTASKPIDDQLQAIVSSWKQRDDFYYPGDMEAIIQAGLNMIKFGQAQLDIVDNKAFTGVAQAEIFKAGQNASDYITALNQAKTKNASVVSAPGFRDWVVDTWNAASLAVYALAYARCARPAVVVGVEALISLSNVFVAVVTKTAQVVVKAGDVVYQATTGALSLAGIVAKYGKFAALGVGVYWIAGKLRESRGR